VPLGNGTTGSWRPCERKNRGLVACGAVNADTESVSKTPDKATTWAESPAPIDR
jgi:hypothetical protein